jgi:enoyl-CoA hydratase/carnithine racemase
MNKILHTLCFTLTDGIGHIELNRPPANQMTAEFFSEFNGLIDELSQRVDLKALVISSKGRHFSAGANIEELLDLAGTETENTGIDINHNWITHSEKNYRSFRFLEETKIPVIAAIKGVCIGSAFELVLYSHFRFCAEDSVFGLPETTFNLMPGLGGIRKLSELCGQAKAIELILKGNTFDAEEAKLYKLVDGIVPRRRVVEFSLQFARKLTKNYHKEKSPLYLQQISQDVTIS